ncbi:unnamed protein product [Vitrella brassicaformis CCMP3155]|uniref:Uncharacterized protein n=1 Tax=Vitrella brassicaformis (strain CCMP3155) TaxID=1169540 RepID=A0A0G4EFD2_VITBC|nr:unnamed protein product [Vitrella brassicaformis CCMP3155]|eukprot:CEL94137.1 unnamed protein product [Vitrella brassicaformis CCMP3155]
MCSSSRSRARPDVACRGVSMAPAAPLAASAAAAAAGRGRGRYAQEFQPTALPHPTTSQPPRTPGRLHQYGFSSTRFELCRPVGHSREAA